MTNKRPSIDGFIPRRPGSQLGERHAGGLDAAKTSDTSYRPTGLQPQDKPVLKCSELGITRSDLDDSLKGIDEVGESKKERRQRKKLAPQSRKRRIIKWSIILFIIALVAVGAWVAYKALHASNSIFKGNIFDIVQNQPLKEDKNGRSNILIFGTSEDDPEHAGGSLTDSIMVISLDQDKKNAFMVSIPRDLYVEYGATCPEGYRGKINSMYSCFSEEDPAKEAEGANALKSKVGEVLGLDVQYYAHLNYTAVRQAVDAVGGVDVTVESEDPRGILDRNFDWRCKYQCYFVNYKNGEKVHMDGEHALAFSRARNAAGGYGLPGGNFDREKNQQKVIKSLREKAVSAGTLTNLGKVTGLMDALGNNLRTNFETKEIRTLMSLGNDIKSEAIQPVSFVEEGNMLVKTGNIGGASIVQPVTGLLEYGDIHTYINKTLNATDVTREAANVMVFNASGVAGVAQAEADKMSEKGIKIAGVDNAPEGKYDAVDIYQIGDGKPATKALLESMFNVKVKTTPSPFTATEGTNFVVIFGKAPASN